MSIDPQNFQIVLYPNPVLRQVAQPVQTVDASIQKICLKMFELMHEAPGVGLAAPQVGLSLRLFVANATGERQDDMAFINPVITVVGRAFEEMEEGCLSLPDIDACIRRPKAVMIEATNINGNRFQVTSDDLPARIWQHENDHLDGVLIIDKMSPIDKMANRKAIKELEG